MTSTIIIATLNARYTHASLGLRYLLANQGEWQAQTSMMEFTITMRPLDIAEQLLIGKPRIIGLGVYIWNITETTALVALLKALAPEVVIVLGGPEVSYETAQQAIVQQADYVITGAGDVSFRQLCGQLMQGHQPLNKIIAGEQVPLAQLTLPYTQYTADDLATRSIYVEASRGCPFKCEFCLSALDKTALPFERQHFLVEMERLWQRGLRQFRFVDRTFNLKIATTVAILDFFLERLDVDMFLHFELIPDHLPDALKERITRFPPGSLQFEIGIQTFNPEVQALISRKQDNAKSAENIRWLREYSAAHLHTDLIFGLPGEDLPSFGAGFDRLIGLNPHEIQVGILKRLRGTPIIRHTEAFGMVYNPQPPYNILRTDRVDFDTMQQMNRFARYWDMIANSGRFAHTLPLLLGDAPFARFWALSAWIYAQVQQTHQIALPRLFVLVHSGGQTLLGIEHSALEDALLQDYAVTGQKGQIPFLSEFRKNRATPRDTGNSGNQRQLRFLS
ncbi:MAG: B12-binding domain-containing radical SAM protein [Thiothrix lacustris]|uniref:B12-binding domain-containing radical SAM protein n=1 Tax=Thiothrix lacustris TaxID=525917 RepID=A0A1Y1QX70_9GAMM|nr:MAG: B12-binding domain-containing radical SAM protein [Thiothrix lacustris]